MRKVEGKNGGFLIPFQKGKSGNPSGRPRKLINQLKVEGYKNNEIYDVANKLATFNKKEYEAFLKEENASIAELILCKYIEKAIKKGDNEFLSIIAPKRNTLPITVENDIDYKIPDDEIMASRKYQELMSVK